MNKKKGPELPLSIRGLSDYAILSKMITNKMERRNNQRNVMSNDTLHNIISRDCADSPERYTNSSYSSKSLSDNSQRISSIYRDSDRCLRVNNKLGNIFFSDDEDLEWKKCDRFSSESSCSDYSSENTSEELYTDDSNEQIIPSNNSVFPKKIMSDYSSKPKLSLDTNTEATVSNLGFVKLTMNALKMRVSAVCIKSCEF